MARSLRYERVYPYPPEQVWQALTDRAALAEWLMETDFVPVVGQRFQFRTNPAPNFDGIVDGEVLVVEPPRKLIYTWTNQRNGLSTLIKWELEAVGSNNTRLKLEHSGFGGFNGLLVSFILGSGWRKALAGAIPHYLAKQALAQAGRV